MAHKMRFQRYSPRGAEKACLLAKIMQDSTVATSQRIGRRMMNDETTGELYRKSDVRVLDDNSRFEDASIEKNTENIIYLALETLKTQEHNIGYLSDEKRTSYVDKVGLKPEDSTLETSSIMGKYTRLIARRCRHIPAVKSFSAQALFSKTWCNQDNPDNVNVCSDGLNGKLPYEFSSYFIFYNYMLDWCKGRSARSAKYFFRKFLKKIYVCICRGGCPYWSTKNRFTIRHLLGRGDEHFGTRFGSALPRALQNTAHRRADLGLQTGYLHAWNKLKHLRSSIDFSALNRLVAFPDARYPECLDLFSDSSRESLSNNIIHQPSNKVSMSFPQWTFDITSNSIVFFAQKDAWRALAV